MRDPATFEARLAAAYERYVADAPVSFDPREVAASAVDATRRPRRGSRPGTMPRSTWLVAAAIAGLLTLAAGAALVGSRGRETVPGPTSVPTAVPTAAPSAAVLDGGYRGEFARVGTVLATAGNTVTPIAVTLADGRVLIAGGGDVFTPNRLDAQVFDPATGESIAVPNAVNGGGSGVLLKDGRVLVIAEDRNATSSFAFLFDPTTMSFQPIPQPGFSNAPPFGVRPSLALLRDGRVLVAGGRADVYKSQLLASAMLFDPETGSFTPTGSMATPRWRHSMTTLPDGRVLVAGGEGSITSLPYLDDAEIYDPTTGTFSSAGRMKRVRGATLAVLLEDGRVALMPRWDQPNDAPELAAPGTQEPAIAEGGPAPVEFYDPTTGAFGVAPGAVPGIPDSATLLRGGQLLLTGAQRQKPGQLFSGWQPWSITFDPATSAIVDLPSPPARLTATASLPDGRVVFAGGFPPESDPPQDPWTGIEIFR